MRPAVRLIERGGMGEQEGTKNKRSIQNYAFPISKKKEKNGDGKGKRRN